MAARNAEGHLAFGILQLAVDFCDQLDIFTNYDSWPNTGQINSVSEV